MGKMSFNHQRFSAIRKTKNISIQELSEKTGLSIDVIKNIEYGRRKKTRKEEIELLCNAIGEDADSFDLDNEERTKVISFMANKGGAGKTSLAVNVAACLAKYFDKRILLIDSDHQQNASQHLGLIPDIDNPEEVEFYDTHNFYRAFINKDDISKHVIHYHDPEMDVVVGDQAIAPLDSQELINMPLKELRVKDVLKGVIERNEYDFIIIDCNPALNKFNEIILYATDYVIIPMEAEPFGLKGANYISEFVANIAQREEANAKVLGIVANKYNKQAKIARAIMSIAEEIYGDSNIIFKTKIPRDINVPNAQGDGYPVCVGYPDSRAVEAYKSLCEEILNRVKYGVWESGFMDDIPEEDEEDI